MAQTPNFVGIDCRLAALTQTEHLGGGDSFAFRVAARGAGWSNSANTPRMSKNALPAAVPVSTGGSVAFSETPLALSSCTMSCRSFSERARRSMRVTTSVFSVLNTGIDRPLGRMRACHNRTTLLNTR